VFSTSVLNDFDPYSSLLSAVYSSGAGRPGENVKAKTAACMAI